MPDRLKELTPYTPPVGSRWEDSSVTRGQALRRAAKFSKTRYRQILALLADGPQCIFELARALSFLTQTTIHDHQISGRFRALVDEGLIEKSGTRRPTPTGCHAEVYQITLAGLAVHMEANHLPDAAKMVPLNPLQTAPEPMGEPSINPGPMPAGQRSALAIQSSSEASR